MADLVYCIACGSGLDVTRSGVINCTECKAKLDVKVEIIRNITMTVVNL